MKDIRKFITSVFGIAFAVFYLVFLVWTGEILFSRIFQQLYDQKVWAYISSILPAIVFVVFGIFAIRAGWIALTVLLSSVHSLGAYLKKHKFHEYGASQEERRREEHTTMLVGLFNVLFFAFSTILLYLFYRGVLFYFDLEGFGSFEVFIASLLFTVAFVIVSLVAWAALLALTVNLSDEDLEQAEEVL